jgi:hypothetical protein
MDLTVTRYAVRDGVAADILVTGRIVRFPPPLETAAAHV